MANIDYEDQMTQIEEEKQERLTETEKMYGEMATNTKEAYDKLIAASQGWVSEQSAIQQQMTDFTIEKIEQEKAQTKKDYTKEQSGAYTDWQKESNRYNAHAEGMATAGLSNSGYSESSQVQMYNTYQNRVAAAREVYNIAILNYNNAIKEAQLQNSSALAEIAAAGLQQQLSLALESIQYENQLLLSQESQKMQIEDSYYNRYMDVLNQMNADRAFEEGVRQFELEMARLKELDQRDYELELAKLNEDKRQFDLTYGNNGIGGFIDKPTTAEEAGAEAAREVMMAQIRNGYYPGSTIGDKDIIDFANSILANKSSLQNKPTSSEDVDLSKSIVGQSTSGYYPGKTTANKDIIDFANSMMPNKSTPATTQNSVSNARTNTKKLTAQEKRIQAEQQKADIAYEVSTPYYRGALSNDALEFGTMANRYQPKGISGHGYLSKTGETDMIPVVIKYGTKKGIEVEVEQNIWKAEDGTRWVWDGMNNCYVSAD